MHELAPFGFAAIGKTLSGLATNLYCNRYGAEREVSDFHREMMNKYGVWRSLPRRELVAQSILLGTGAGLYICDKLLGIENELINLHKGWLYGMGGFIYFTALSNSKNYIVDRIKDFRKNSKADNSELTKL